ncbi:MAG: DMT family transporter [Pseudomonadota bacterium]
MPRHIAIILVLSAAFCMSFAALFVRLIETADGFQILVYRSVAQGLFVSGIALYLERQRLGAFFKNIDRDDVLIAVLMMIAFSTYVLALLNTSVASALFILSIAPVFAALLGWLVNGERPSLVAAVCIGLAVLGVGVMIQGGLEGGKTFGNVLAVLSALAFATMLVTARKSKKSNVLKGNGMGALLAALVMTPIALTFSDGGLSIPVIDIWLAMGSGVVTIGLGILFLSLSAPHLPAHEVSLLVLLESILSPIWTSMFLNEKIETAELVGGFLVLLSVIFLTIFGKRLEN